MFCRSCNINTRSNDFIAVYINKQRKPSLWLSYDATWYNIWYDIYISFIMWQNELRLWFNHYDDVIMRAMASQITSLTIVCSNVYSRRRSKESSKLRVAGLVRGVHQWAVNSPHKWPVTRKMFTFDDVIMQSKRKMVIMTLHNQLWIVT